MDEYRAFLEQRRLSSQTRLESFSQALEKEIGSEHFELIGDHTSVYVVGSGGRDELSEHSDLDLFLVKQGTPLRVDEVRLQSAIVHALDKEKIKRPSDDARFLKLHAAQTLIQNLGEPTDDAENTFTVRMLLLLESKALFGGDVHAQLLRDCVDAYWKNTDTHAHNYLPIILVNDIIRYWRILLLNYESKTERERRKAGQGSSIDPDLEADRRLRTCKLRFSRCLMCYASIVYMLAETHATRMQSGIACVSREAITRMLALTPVERLDAALKRVPELESAQGGGARLLSLYADFLKEADSAFGYPCDSEPVPRNARASCTLALHRNPKWWKFSCGFSGSWVRRK